MTNYIETPEEDRALWRAVIVQALNDAQGTKSAMGQLDAVRAREWFTEAGSDFQEVCHLAGLDPDAVQARAVYVLSSNQPARRPYRKRDKGGVVSDFEAQSGTGGGSHAQDISELEFSE